MTSLQVQNGIEYCGYCVGAYQTMQTCARSVEYPHNPSQGHSKSNRYLDMGKGGTSLQVHLSLGALVTCDWSCVNSKWVCSVSVSPGHNAHLCCGYLIAGVIIAKLSPPANLRVVSFDRAKYADEQEKMGALKSFWRKELLRKHCDGKGVCVCNVHKVSEGWMEWSKFTKCNHQGKL